MTRTARLQGLDMARFLAFCGMVIVNFRIVMGAEGGSGWMAAFAQGLEGRAAASFVVLAGIGLGLSAARADYTATFGVTTKRALFLLVAGLLNMLIFDADILHYYAFYFFFGVLLLPMRGSLLAIVILILNALAVTLLLTLDFEAGWDFSTYSYPEFWTPVGFVRNLFFNGWHPVIPWLGFLLLGMLLARLPLDQPRIQGAMMVSGLVAIATAEGLAAGLRGAFGDLDPDLAEVLTTGAVPATPLYTLAGSGFAACLIGACLWLADRPVMAPVVRLITPAGRQALTLYLAHILVGMVTLEALGLLGGQSIATALSAAGFFCLASLLYALAWSHQFKHGPVEALMRRLAG